MTEASPGKEGGAPRMGTPEGDDLRVEVRGALAGILHLATGGAALDGAGAGMASAGAGSQGVVMPGESLDVLGMFGLQIKMDAGTGFGLCRTRLG